MHTFVNCVLEYLYVYYLMKYTLASLQRSNELMTKLMEQRQFCCQIDVHIMYLRRYVETLHFPSISYNYHIFFACDNYGLLFCQNVIPMRPGHASEDNQHHPWEMIRRI